MICKLSSLLSERLIGVFKLTTAVAVFLATLVQPAVAGDAQAGQDKSAACAACHGPGGNSVVATWPSLAGQNESYLLETLRGFKNGDRVDPVMSAQVVALSDTDLQDLAAYFAEQKAQTRTADPKLANAGERLYRGGNKDSEVSACIACHGPTGRGNLPAGYPMLASQHAAYTAKQLNDYKNGTRKSVGDIQMMRTIAERLTPAEIEAVAAYIQGLR